MTSKSVTEQMSDKVKEFISFIEKKLEEYDAASWPAFLTFIAIVTLGMILNYFGFEPVVGWVAAIAITFMFETAILSWKLTTNRRKNDAAQQQIAEWATWVSVLLAVAMLIVNLFRVGGDTHFETVAYAIVGAAALAQIIFYLCFDHADPDKRIIRDHAQAERELRRKRENARNVIDEIRADMDIVRLVRDGLNDLRMKNSDLPTPELEELLERGRKKLLAEYAPGNAQANAATAHLADINGDGKIGKPDFR